MYNSLFINENLDKGSHSEDALEIQKITVRGFANRILKHSETL